MRLFSLCFVFATLVATGLTPSAGRAQTVPTYTEKQVLSWDSPTPTAAGSGFGATLTVGETPSGSTLALVGVPGMGAAQFFVLAPGASQWTSLPPLLPPTLPSPASLPMVFDGGPIYATLDPGGTTSTIRNADTGQILLAGINGAVSALAKSGPTLAVADVAFFSDGGRVRIYEQNAAGSWILVKTFVGDVGSKLGSSLAMDGLVVAAGAPLQGANGAVHIYARATEWIELQEILSPATSQDGAWFGLSVALDGAVLAIGSPFLDRSSSAGLTLDVGGVYIYEPRTLPFLLYEIQALLRPSQLTKGDLFGWSVALAEPVAGKPILVAGAPREDAGAFNAGAVYRYQGLSFPHLPRWCLVSRWVRSTPGENDSLGWRVAFWRSGILAGAPFPQTVSVNPGAVLYFDLGIFSDGFDCGDFSGWSLVVP